MNIIVLGAGLVGAPMAIDLAKNPSFDVTVADVDTSNLKRLEKHPVSTIHKDLSDPGDVADLVGGYDLVLNAVPGFMGFRTLEAIIDAGKDVVDIAFFAEDPFLLDEMAKKKGVTAIVDCGVAPGMSNILVGHADRLLDETEDVLIYVGGLPECRQWPYEYKAVFSPLDVIEEYTRPARYVENGRLVTRPALSDAELLDFPPLGTLEAFNSDGLRSLAVTLDIPNMKEKTLRYPGHIEKMAVLRDTGFFSREPIDVGGASIRPLDFTSKVLFPKWQMTEGEVDITVLKVVVAGRKDGERVEYVYNLVDKYDPATATHSMARTTGYTATVAVRMLAEGLFRQKGICPPEYIGRQPECVEFMLKGLAARGVVYNETLSELEH
jgi:saccharopine dehydrogenase-like NADP-dependent oxidoreductase